MFLKMNKVKIAISAIAVATMTISNVAFADKLQEVLDRGHLVLGTGSMNAPWHFKDSSGKLVGFDVDMGRLVAKGLFGNPDAIKYVNQSSDSRIPNLVTNKVDLTCQFMTVTAERAQQVEFTVPYYREGLGLMMMAKSKYRGLKDLKRAGSKVTIAALQNVYAEAAIHLMLPKAKVDQYESVDLIYQAINSGRADAGETDISSLRWFMVNNVGRYKDSGASWFPSSYSCAIKPGDQRWLNFVNSVLKEAMTGVEFTAYSESYKKWFGVQLDSPKLGFPAEFK